jgi:hypothetical protein
MSTLAIIRVFPVDDWIAYNCFNSLKEVIGCDVVFFAEQGFYKWIGTTNSPIVYRRECGNFGGEKGVNTCIDFLTKIDVSKYENIILCDSDITVLKNPLEFEFTFGGIQDINNPRHFSGQFLIFKRWLFEKVLKYDGYNELIDKFVNEGQVDVADDTCLSYVATEYTDNTFDFLNKHFWLHEKLHHLEPK